MEFGKILFINFKIKDLNKNMVNASLLGKISIFLFRITFGIWDEISDVKKILKFKTENKKTGDLL